MPTMTIFASRLTLTAVASAMLLAGCAVGPDYVRPAASLPSAFDTASISAPASVDAEWWKQFQDSTLNTLVEQALGNNADIRVAIARVEQASAVARETGAAFLPEIDGQLGVTNRELSTRTASYNTNVPRQSNARNATLSTSYEIDIWGRARRGNEAAQASLFASQYSRDAVRLSIAGLVSSNYLALRAYDAELAVTAESISSRETSLKLVQTRLDAGLVSPLDLYQAESALAALQAQAATLRQQRAISEHQIALLTAQPDLKIAAGDLRQLPLPPLPPAGLPSELIEGRPDVRQAEETLIAANAGIGIAKAGYFPKFTLTGSLGSESKTLSDLFSSGSNAWSLGLGLLMPVIDFGRTSARVDQAKAVNQQSLIAWEKTLQTAFKEVRDALVSLRENGAAETAQNTRADRTRKALEIAQRRYDAGYSGYLEVLDAQRSNNEAVLAMIATRQARLAASVDLFKALGGGWKNAALSANKG